MYPAILKYINANHNINKYIIHRNNGHFLSFFINEFFHEANEVMKNIFLNEKKNDYDFHPNS